MKKLRDQYIIFHWLEPEGCLKPSPLKSRDFVFNKPHGPVSENQLTTRSGKSTHVIGDKALVFNTSSVDGVIF